MKTSKNHLFLTFAFFLFTVSLTAQTTVGIRAGTNSSTLAIEFPDQNGFSPFDAEGLNLGVFLNVPLGKKLSIQPELNYNQKVFSIFDIKLPGVPRIKTDLAFNAIDLSLLAKYRMGKNKFGFSVAAGPSLNVLVDGAYKFQGDGNRNKEKIQLSSLGMDHLEMGVVCGIGFDYQVGPGKVILDIRHNLGLTDVFYSTSADQNQSTAVSIGYAIKL